MVLGRAVPSFPLGLKVLFASNEVSLFNFHFEMPVYVELCQFPSYTVQHYLPIVD
jgi:hypothetical protein